MSEIFICSHIFIENFDVMNTKSDEQDVFYANLQYFSIPQCASRIHQNDLRQLCILKNILPFVDHS